MALGAVLLSVVFPFAVVVLLAAAALWAAWESSAQHRLIWRKPLLLAAGSIPYLVIQYQVIRGDSLLSAWNAQNQTPSLPWWDTTVAFSPALLLAAVGLVHILRKDYTSGRILAAWAAASLGLLLVPFNLQRRFIVGLFIPLAGLAAYGWISLSSSGFFRRRAGLLVMLLSIPTSLLVLGSAFSGISTTDHRLYLARDEAAMLEWMLHNLDRQDIVLAAPSTGLFIPGWSGQQVVYGHPFETVNAGEMKMLAEQAVSGEITLDEFIDLSGIKPDYLFWGPREALLNPAPPAGLGIVHSAGDVILFRIP